MSSISSDYEQNRYYGSVEAVRENTSVHDDTEDLTYAGLEMTELLSSRETLKSLNPMPVAHICAILSSAFSYGCVMGTLFLLTLPVECERFDSNGNSSLMLGMFAALAGLTQLVTPVVGKVSDIYYLKKQKERMAAPFKQKEEDDYDNDGEQGRMPYIVVGSILMVIGILGQLGFRGNGDIGNANIGFGNSDSSALVFTFYTLSFIVNMIGINVVYCIMIALIPDLVPKEQTGLANGTLAFQLVMGSLFGFGMYQLINSVKWMYIVYVFVTISTAIITYMIAHPREQFLQTMQFQQQQQQQQQQQKYLETSALISKSKGDNLNTKDDVETKLLCWDEISVGEWMNDLFVKPLVESNTGWKEIMDTFTIDRKLYHDFYVVTISRLFYYMGVSSQTFFLFFIHDRIIAQSPDVSSSEQNYDARQMVSTLAMIGQTCGALTCIPVGILSDQYFSGRRKPFVYISCFLFAISFVSIVFTTTYHQMMICLVIAGAANGMYLTMDTSLAVDTLPNNINEEEDTENNQKGYETKGSAQLLGAWGVAGFLGTTVGPLIFGPVLFIFGHIPKSEHSFAHYQLNGYIMLYSISAIFFILSAYSLTFVRKRGV